VCHGFAEAVPGRSGASCLSPAAQAFLPVAGSPGILACGQEDGHSCLSWLPIRGIPAESHLHRRTGVAYWLPKRPALA